MLSPSFAQHILYFKRYRMELHLDDAPAAPELPIGYSWTSWSADVLNQHAEVKYQSFADEIDATVFPNLGDWNGCHGLMHEICHRTGFCPQATWLIRHGTEACGTVQGVADRLGRGLIQNLGVAPLFRGNGLGTALLLKALSGFKQAGLKIGLLEVTARNEAALRLYRRLGFRCRKTIYKAVDTETTSAKSPIHEESLVGYQ